MCITAKKISDILEFLQKKWNINYDFMRMRENIMNFVAFSK